VTVHLLHTQIYCCETTSIYKSLFCAFWTFSGTD